MGTPSLGRNFNLFLASTSMVGFATSCLQLAVSWYAAKVTGSATVFATMVAIAGFAEVYSKPLLSPLADYFDRLRVFRVCAALGAATTALILGSILFLPFSAAWLTALLVVLGVLAGLRDPASGALVPTLVASADLTVAQARRSTASTVVQLGGSMTGAALVMVSGVATAAGVASALLLGGSLLAGLVRRESAPSGAAAPAQLVSPSWAHYAQTWRSRTVAGLRAVWRTKCERSTAIANALLNAGLFPMTALIMPLWVSRTLQQPAAVMAFIEGSMALGIVAGSSLINARVSAACGRFWAMTGGLFAVSGTTLVASFLTWPPAIMACFFVAGVGVALFFINSSTLRAIATPASFRARMIGGVAFVSCCLYPLISPAVGMFIDRFGPDRAVTACAITILVAGFVLLSNATARRLLSQSNDASVGAYANLYPSAFEEEAAPAAATAGTGAKS